MLVKRFFIFDVCIRFCFFFLLGCFLPLKMKSDYFICVLFCFNTRLDCFIVWIELSVSFLFVFALMFVFFTFIRKSAKIRNTAKNKKPKCRKTPPKCFSVSEVVFTNGVPNVWGVGLMQICAENTITSSFGKNQKWPKIVQIKVKIGPSVSQRLVHGVEHNWTVFEILCLLLSDYEKIPWSSMFFLCIMLVKRLFIFLMLCFCLCFCCWVVCFLK